jgi:hypothetical protein
MGEMNGTAHKPKPPTVAHELTDDAEFLRAIQKQTMSLRRGFREIGYDPHNVPEGTVITIYPAVLFRLVKLITKAKRQGFLQ